MRDPSWKPIKETIRYGPVVDSSRNRQTWKVFELEYWNNNIRIRISNIFFILKIVLHVLNWNATHYAVPRIEFGISTRTGIKLVLYRRYWLKTKIGR